MGASQSIAGPGLVFTIGRAILRPVLRLRFRPTITGLEHIPATGPVLLASNHLSALDTILIPSFSPRKVQFLAKESLFKGRISGWFFRQIGAIPVHRSAGSAAQLALDAGQRVLAEGQVFAVFPEGSRSTDGRLYRGRGGAAFLALASCAAIVPVGIIGSNSKFTDAYEKPARLMLRFGAPIPYADLSELPSSQARRELTERIMQAIAKLSEQDRCNDYAAGSREPSS